MKQNQTALSTAANNRLPEWLKGIPDEVLAISTNRLDLPPQIIKILIKTKLSTVRDFSQHSQYWMLKNVRNLDLIAVRSIAQSVNERLGILIPEYTQEEAEEIKDILAGIKANK